MDLRNDLNVAGDLVVSGGGFAVSGNQSSLPDSYTSFLPTMTAPQKCWRAGFDKAVANNLDSADFTLMRTGAGMTVNQTGGNAVFTAGTTTYSETIARGNRELRGDQTLRYSVTLSQRIANQEFYVELVDIVANNVSFTINSSTSITVTLPEGHGFTAENVGQSMYVGSFSIGSCLSMRRTISAVSGDNITFAVTGFPGSGSGTCSLWGWNYHHVMYNGTNVNQAFYDTQRKGYASGETTVTVNSTTTGHVGIMVARDATGAFLDQTSSSSTIVETTQRGSRVRNLPGSDTPLYLQVRIVNLAAAPASSTTLTLGFVTAENFSQQQVTIAGTQPFSMNAPLSVTMPMALPTGSNTIGTVNIASPGTTGSSLGKNEDSNHGSGDTGVAIWAVRTDTPATTAGATGRYDALHTSAEGGLQSANIATARTGMLRSRVASAATTNAASVKASAGTVWGIELFNSSATAKFFKLYNKASAPTVGTDVPAETILVPAGGGLVAHMRMDEFSTGIAYAITGAVADADTTAVAANDVHGVLLYK